MTMRARWTFLLLSAAGTPAALAQTPFRYQVPPDPIPRIVAAPPLPTALVAPAGNRLALLERDALPRLADLARPELGLAGVRIDPERRAPSRVRPFVGLVIRSLDGGTERRAQLPPGTRFLYPTWSPDGNALALLAIEDRGLALWVVDAATGRARRLTEAEVNATMPGMPYAWHPDGTALWFLRVPPQGPPPAPSLPDGPVVQETRGRAAGARTYQDLLRSPDDERRFVYYFTSVVARVDRDGGPVRSLGEPALWRRVRPSPDGRYLLVERVVPPFSYTVPLNRFGFEAWVWTAEGQPVHRVVAQPVADAVPIAFDAVPSGPRQLDWRADAPATLVWVEALDGGDPRRPATNRDRLVAWAAPFAGQPTPLAETPHRIARVLWGHDSLALVVTRWTATRTERRYWLRPDRPGSLAMWLERSTEDRYGDPGDPVTLPGDQDRLRLGPDSASLYLAGEGASPQGVFPFLDRVHSRTGQRQRLWQARAPYYEEVVAVLDPAARRVLTRRESTNEPPNYVLRTLPGPRAVALTNFPDPAPEFRSVQRRVITYRRDDGLQLSGTLYLPPGYDPRRDGPLPLLMWAYPREYLDPRAAAQVAESPYRFSRPTGASHLFLLLRGYAILDGPAMPIVAQDGREPNDTYIEQLVADARAAVDAVVRLGVADPRRIAIGGHSYGAFMTANLLAHSDLFRAGIARSGAYNRTLTPFGFQNEERTYWQAREVYHRMSPFTYADRVNEPILLIHGQADENPGTFPIQSERFFAALQGLGGTARLVLLPYEGHGYQAQESVLHVLWEMATWLDRWLRPSGRQAANQRDDLAQRPPPQVGVDRQRR